MTRRALMICPWLCTGAMLAGLFAITPQRDGASTEPAPAVQAARPDAKTPPYDHLLPDGRRIVVDAWGFGHAETPVMSICFAPGTPLEYVERVSAELYDLAPGQRFNIASRWPGTPGTPHALTWSLVPDGTTNVPGLTGQSPTTSDLLAQMDSFFAGQGGRATWVGRVQQCFSRWEALSGMSYTRIVVANDADDGAAFGSSGAAGVRGDVRIAMRLLDGGGGVLAFNFFPGTGSGGDMVLDSGEGANWASGAGSQNLFMRNIILHEHGHGLGFAHVCPINNTKLMEPFLSTSFDGPQHDDIRAVHQNYGDAFEPNNAADGSAPSIGTVNIGAPVTIGPTPAPVVANASIVSIHPSSDNDYFRFTVTGPRRLDALLEPVGLPSYDSSEQACSGQPGSCCSGNFINSLTMANLAMQIIAPNGSTVIATASGQAAGFNEVITNAHLLSAGTYYIRVFPEAAPTQVQMYRFTLTVSDLDCNSNGIPDPQDIINGTSLDCNLDGVPDECQVPPLCTFCTDCNSDGIPDNCQVPPICPSCDDCNSNGVPDECETDCNSNGRPDQCDINLGISQDCQPDAIPDECQVPPLCPSCNDCDQNGVPDLCQLISGQLSDCNNDSIPDRCQTDPSLCGGSCLTDCNSNFVPDACEIIGSFMQQSPHLSPIHFTSPQSYLIVSPPVASGPVTLDFEAIADLGAVSEFIDVNVNGTPLGSIFVNAQPDCTLDQTQILTSAAVWNAAVNAGNAVINMIPQNTVDPICGASSYIMVKVTYDTAAGDCNGNGELDACEIAAGTVSDCNANDIPDSCDITQGVLSDLDQNQIPDDCVCGTACNGDFNYDFSINGDDIQGFVNCYLGNGNLAVNDCACADFDLDLRLTAADVVLFVNKLLTDPDAFCD